MQFLLMICHDDRFMPSANLIEQVIAWNSQMAGRGALVYSNPLKPSDEAKTIRVRGGKKVVTNGPFEATKEKLAAYALVNADSLDGAVELAALHPMASQATIEVRPVWGDLASEI